MMFNRTMRSVLYDSFSCAIYVISTYILHGNDMLFGIWCMLNIMCYVSASHMLYTVSVYVICYVNVYVFCVYCVRSV
jgi:hypothetical protein